MALAKVCPVQWVACILHLGLPFFRDIDFLGTLIVQLCVPWDFGIIATVCIYMPGVQLKYFVPAVEDIERTVRTDAAVQRL